jgi:hypothetical protein
VWCGGASSSVGGGRLVNGEREGSVGARGRRTRTVYELARTNIEARKCRLEVKCDGKLEIKHAHEPGLDFFT